MAIGKPLLVNQRREVERPVLAAQTQGLSSNVAAQKIVMADYIQIPRVWLRIN